MNSSKTLTIGQVDQVLDLEQLANLVWTIVSKIEVTTNPDGTRDVVFYFLDADTAWVYLGKTINAFKSDEFCRLQRQLEPGPN